MLAIPRGPAADAAEPGVLAARRERGAALLTVPDIGHHCHVFTPAGTALPASAHRPATSDHRPVWPWILKLTNSSCG
jgi:hypothetical protein